MSTRSFKPIQDLATSEVFRSEDDLRDQFLADTLDRYLALIHDGDRIAAEQLLQQVPEHRSHLQSCARSLMLLEASVGNRFGKEDVSLDKQLGDFRLEKEISRGGMGIVYEGYQISMGRKVAIKILPFAAVLDPNQIARFQREAQAAGSLHHPHIVPVYAVGCERGVHYYSMQFIDGQSLEQVIDDLRRKESISSASKTSRDQDANTLTSQLSTERVKANAATYRTSFDSFSPKSNQHYQSLAKLMRQAADALAYAHQNGIIHRDIKPANLLVDRSTHLWITDFGLARCEHLSALTHQGELVGTLRYMSPEQVAGRSHQLDNRTDIYSLGATFYELLTLRPLFAGNDRSLLMKQIEQEEPIAPRRINPSIPIDLETIVLKAIAKGRDDRFETAEQFSEELSRFCQGLPIHVRRLRLVDRVKRSLARNPGKVLVSCIISFIGALLSFLLAMHLQQLNHRAELHLHTAHQVVDDFGLQLIEQLKGFPESESTQIEVLEKSLAYYEAFNEYAGQRPDLQAQRAAALMRMAAIHRELGDLAAARDFYRTSLSLLDHLTGVSPSDDKVRFLYAITLHNAARVLFELKDPKAAEDSYRHSIRLQRELVRSKYETIDYPLGLAKSLNALGELKYHQEDLISAKRLFTEAIDLAQHLAATDPTNAEALFTLAASLNNSSQLPSLPLQERTDNLQQAIKLLRALESDSPLAPVQQRELAVYLSNLAEVHEENGKKDLAMEDYREALERLSELARKFPKVVDYRVDFAVAKSRLAALHANLGEFDQAHQELKSAEGELLKVHLSQGESESLERQLLLIRDNIQAICDRKESNRALSP